jgi:hypothetical protein
LPLNFSNFRREDIDYEYDEGNSYVYKTDREMEYRRPAVILQVGDSNQLYKPGIFLDILKPPKELNYKWRFVSSKLEV